MLLAERAGRKLEHWSNPVPRGMVVITGNRRNRIRPIGLLYIIAWRDLYRSRHFLWCLVLSALSDYIVWDQRNVITALYFFSHAIYDNAFRTCLRIV
jgi:hypothetical protein